MKKGSLYSILLIVLNFSVLLAQDVGTAEDDLNFILKKEMNELHLDNFLQLATQSYSEKYEDLLRTRGYANKYESVSSNYLFLLSATYQKLYSSNSSQPGILFYSVQDDSLSIWLIHDIQIKAHSKKAINRDELVKMVINLRSELGVSEDSIRYVRGVSAETVYNQNNDLITSLNKLSDVILPEEIAIELHNINHLIVVPEFVISQVPFYLLLLPNGDHLLDALSVSVAPTMMNAERYKSFFYSSDIIGKQVKFTFESSLVVGNPRFSSQLNLSDLSGAEDEAVFVSELLGGKLLLGDSAKISKVVKESTSSDLLYFATHARSEYENAMDNSYIVLTPDLNDSLGIWTAREIMNTKLNADLAIISACETGIGQVHEGGTIGLMSAFYLAGVDNTILSYWPVNDEATKEFMQIFIAKLEIPMVGFPATNLREAILEYRKIDPNPYNWAAFANYGYPY